MLIFCGSLSKVGVNYGLADCFIKQCMDYGNCGADGVLPSGHSRTACTCTYGTAECAENGSQKCHAAIAGGLLSIPG